jgi:hypothetical protein
MPVIRGILKPSSLTPERERELLDKLILELSGELSPDGPVIFQIPLEQSNKFDVIVVWNAFEGLRPEESTKLILDAYGDQKEQIALAMGATYREAVAQHLLPYSLVPMTKRSQVDPAELRKAMLEAGGIALSNEKVDLLFPTMAMAQAAHQRLSEQLPDVYWSICEAVGPIP